MNAPPFLIGIMFLSGVTLAKDGDVVAVHQGFPSAWLSEFSAWSGDTHKEDCDFGAAYSDQEIQSLDEMPGHSVSGLKGISAHIVLSVSESTGKRERKLYFVRNKQKTPAIGENYLPQWSTPDKTIKELVSAINRMPVFLSVKGSDGNQLQARIVPNMMMEDTGSVHIDVPSDHAQDDFDQNKGTDDTKPFNEDDAENRENSGDGDKGGPPDKGLECSLFKAALEKALQVARYPVTTIAIIAFSFSSGKTYQEIQKRQASHTQSDLTVAANKQYRLLLTYYGKAVVHVTLSPKMLLSEISKQNTSDYRNSEDFSIYGFQIPGAFSYAKSRGKLLGEYNGCPHSGLSDWRGCIAVISVPEESLSAQLAALNISNDRYVKIYGSARNVLPTYWCPCNSNPLPEQPVVIPEENGLIASAWNAFYIGMPTLMAILFDRFVYQRFVYKDYIAPRLSFLPQEE